MPLEKQQTQDRTCPSCGHRPLELKYIRDEFDYGPDDERVHIVADNVPVLACPQCGEQLHGPEAARVHHEAICRTLGLLTPEQIKDLRERLVGKNQGKFARVSGIGVATLSRWERGRLMQNRALDHYLRVLQAFPQAVRLLETLEVSAEKPGRWRHLQVTPEVQKRQVAFQRHGPLISVAEPNGAEAKTPEIGAPTSELQPSG